MTEFETDLMANTGSMQRLLRRFVASSLLVGGGLGGWAAMAEIDSAVVTSGTFVVESNAQAVQHLEGGIVSALLVKDGDLVQEGQVLVRLDAAKVVAEASIRERRLIELTAEKARLEAEHLDRTVVEPPVLDVSSVQALSALQAALAAEQRLLAERRSTRASQLAQLEERRTQAKKQIEGLGQRFSAFKEELAQASAELADFRALDSKGLIRRPVLRQSERDVSRLKGEIGDTEARIASARSQLTETESKIAEATLAARSEVLRQLQTVNAKIAEIEEERSAANDRLRRLDIRAPRTGHVNSLQVHTVGGIVAPGHKLMSIIPTSDRLVVNAKVRPTDVDQVHKGSRATVRVSSFRLPVTPELEGEVTGVSPDQVVDSQTGQAFFTVQISVEPDERHKLHGKDLTPGLPAEVLIRGDARRVITYLVQPVLDGMSVAFREK